MQFATLAALFALSSSHVVIAQGLFPCGTDFCGIVVGGPGSNPPLSVRQADCSSFLLATIPSTTVTVTSTIPRSITTTTRTTFSTTTSTTTGITVTTDNAPNQRLARRATITPSVLPTYAAYICNPSTYRSICSCIGVSASTTISGSAVTTTTTASTSTITSIRTSTTIATSVITTTSVSVLPRL
ncbi:uncharacterized protein PgNI_11795 [Pyricularia grisea]|uniref:Uncharacterized protein n=1 Tax=Pyricularia grisea TaxID=148305 RepID=A0A6P8ANR5_PYRGI|nr:uncharacterized protein PgNI_11795 [Pyricularia grisea]TLD03675.1 hypothetical protein PgNI_11795 [Pyricularia grisea]